MHMQIFTMFDYFMNEFPFLRVVLEVLEILTDGFLDMLFKFDTDTVLPVVSSALNFMKLLPIDDFR